MCLQVSQETSTMVWYSHLFKNYPQFVVIHTVKGFSIVTEAEVYVFLEYPCFSKIQQMLPIWSLAPLPCLNPACTSGSSQFTYCWKQAWRIFDLDFAHLWNECSCAVIWHSLALPLFGIGMITDLFQSSGHCWVFQICWHIEYSTLPASSFRIWSSSTGIPSPPLALFVVVVP